MQGSYERLDDLIEQREHVLKFQVKYIARACKASKQSPNDIKQKSLALLEAALNALTNGKVKARRRKLFDAYCAWWTLPVFFPLPFLAPTTSLFLFDGVPNSQINKALQDCEWFNEAVHDTFESIGVPVPPLNESRVIQQVVKTKAIDTTITSSAVQAAGVTQPTEVESTLHNASPPPAKSTPVPTTVERDTMQLAHQLLLQSRSAILDKETSPNSTTVETAAPLKRNASEGVEEQSAAPAPSFGPRGLPAKLPRFQKDKHKDPSSPPSLRAPLPASLPEPSPPAAPAVAKALPAAKAASLGSNKKIQFNLPPKPSFAQNIALPNTTPDVVESHAQSPPSGPSRVRPANMRLDQEATRRRLARALKQKRTPDQSVVALPAEGSLPLPTSLPEVKVPFVRPKPAGVLQSYPPKSMSPSLPRHVSSSPDTADEASFQRKRKRSSADFDVDVATEVDSKSLDASESAPMSVNQPQHALAMPSPSASEPVSASLIEGAMQEVADSWSHLVKQKGRKSKAKLDLAKWRQSASQGPEASTSKTQKRRKLLPLEPEEEAAAAAAVAPQITEAMEEGECTPEVSASSEILQKVSQTTAGPEPSSTSNAIIDHPVEPTSALHPQQAARLPYPSDVDHSDDDQQIASMLVPDGKEQKTPGDSRGAREALGSCIAQPDILEASHGPALQLQTTTGQVAPSLEAPLSTVDNSVPTAPLPQESPLHPALQRHHSVSSTTSQVDNALLELDALLDEDFEVVAAAEAVKYPPYEVSLPVPTGNSKWYTPAFPVPIVQPALPFPVLVTAVEQLQLGRPPNPFPRFRRPDSKTPGAISHAPVPLLRMPDSTRTLAPRGQLRTFECKDGVVCSCRTCLAARDYLKRQFALQTRSGQVGQVGRASSQPPASTTASQGRIQTIRSATTLPQVSHPVLTAPSIVSNTAHQKIVASSKAPASHSAGPVSVPATQASEPYWATLPIPPGREPVPALTNYWTTLEALPVLRTSPTKQQFQADPVISLRNLIGTFWALSGTAAFMHDGAQQHMKDEWVRLSAELCHTKNFGPEFAIDFLTFYDDLFPSFVRSEIHDRFKSRMSTDEPLRQKFNQYQSLAVALSTTSKLWFVQQLCNKFPPVNSLYYCVVNRLVPLRRSVVIWSPSRELLYFIPRSILGAIQQQSARPNNLQQLAPAQNSLLQSAPAPSTSPPSLVPVALGSQQQTSAPSFAWHQGGSQEPSGAVASLSNTNKALVGLIKADSPCAYCARLQRDCLWHPQKTRCALCEQLDTACVRSTLAVQDTASGPQASIPGSSDGQFAAQHTGPLDSVVPPTPELVTPTLSQVKSDTVRETDKHASSNNSVTEAGRLHASAPHATAADIKDGATNTNDITASELFVQKAEYRNQFAKFEAAVARSGLLMKELISRFKVAQTAIAEEPAIAQSAFQSFSHLDAHKIVTLLDWAAEQGAQLRSVAVASPSSKVVPKVIAHLDRLIQQVANYKMVVGRIVDEGVTLEAVVAAKGKENDRAVPDTNNSTARKSQPGVPHKPTPAPFSQNETKEEKALTSQNAPTLKPPPPLNRKPVTIRRSRTKSAVPVPVPDDMRATSAPAMSKGKGSEGNLSSGSTSDRSLRKQKAANYAERSSNLATGSKLQTLSRSPPRALALTYDHSNPSLSNSEPFTLLETLQKS